MEIIKLPRKQRAQERPRVWPPELLNHIEHCLGLPVRQALSIIDWKDFFSSVKWEANRYRDNNCTPGQLLEMSIYEKAAHQYRIGFCDLEEPTCIFEPTHPGGVVDQIKNGDVQGLKRRLDEGLDADGYNLAGIPLLSLAVVHMQPGCVELLLTYCASPKTRGYWLVAEPLDYVMPAPLSDSFGHQDAIIRMLINAGSSFSYFNVLDSIFLSDSLDLLRKVVQQPPGLFANWPNSGYEMILLRVARYGKGCVEIADLIVTMVPEVLEVKTTLGDTALHFALFNIEAESMVKNLLRFRIDLLALNATNVSALAIAVRKGLVGAVEAMLSRQYIDLLQLHEVIPFSETPLGQAIETRNEYLMHLLLTDRCMCLTERAQNAALDLARVWGYEGSWVALIQNLQIWAQ
ncbi:hypothetical protein CBS147346_65 [Aspergillus niger]|nr:hypothetical protein CBS147346_65 [Aspergillus niger]